MELQQLEATHFIEAEDNFNRESLKVISKLNPCLAEDERLLLYYYKQVISATGKGKEFSLGGVPEDNAFSESLVQRDNLSNSPFQADLLESEALQIAQEQIQILESQLKEKEQQLQQQEEQLKQSENFSFLLLSHRLLSPGLPLNGTEESPAMRVLGSPKTRTELEANYRELIKREHPDVSRFPIDVAIERFAYVRSLYRITRMNWTVLKPTAFIPPEDLTARMNAAVPFDVESFWVT